MDFLSENMEITYGNESKSVYYQRNQWLAHGNWRARLCANRSGCLAAKPCLFSFFKVIFGDRRRRLAEVWGNGLPFVARKRLFDSGGADLWIWRRRVYGKAIFPYSPDQAGWIRHGYGTAPR